MSKPESGLPYDELGFLIGLKQTGRDVSKIDKNVEQIRDILIGLGKELENQYSRAESPPKQKLSALEQALIDAQIKPADFSDLIREQANPLVQSSLALDRVAKSIEDLIAESTKTEDSKPQPKAKPKRRAIEINSTEDVIREFGNTGERRRDANGRFIGANSEQSTLGKVAQTIGTAIKGVMPSNPQGVDPTLDAINEVANVLSPVKRAAGFMLRPLTGWMKSRKRNEPLPKEQSDHNRKQVKLLQRIADNLQSRGGLLGGLGKLLGAGGGLLGGLLAGLLGKGKGLGKGLAKILKFGKGLPVIGALLTAMSFSDWGTKTTKEKGGTVGSAVGGVAGGAIGSIFGPVGTIAGAAIGSWVGEKLGGIVAPYVKEWTDSLIEADIPSMISKLVSAALKLTPAGMVKSLYDWGKERWDEKFNGQPNPSYLLRSQYGGKGENGGVPVKFGAAYNSGNLGKYKQLADAIAKDEGTYTSVNTGGNPNRRVKGDFQSKNVPNLTDMTIDEILKANEKPFGDSNRVNAAGKYQIIASTLKNVKKSMGLNGSEKFTPELQDKMFMHLLPNSAKNYIEGKKVSKDKAIADISGVWSSVANPNTGKTSHQDGINKASSKSIELVGNALDSAKANTSVPLDTMTNQQENSQISLKSSAKSIVNNAKQNVPVLNMQSSVKPLALRTNILAAGFTPPKIETNVQPSKEFLTSPSPQEVVVTNQNSGTINQNVSNRLLAHAITGGLGMGDKWNV